MIRGANLAAVRRYAIAILLEAAAILALAGGALLLAAIAEVVVR